jgi:hypothetical protein
MQYTSYIHCEIASCPGKPFLFTILLHRPTAPKHQCKPYSPDSNQQPSDQEIVSMTIPTEYQLVCTRYAGLYVLASILYDLVLKK